MSQPLSLKDQLKALVHLQELDSKIDSLRKNKGALPAALKTIDDQLAKLAATVATKTKTADESEKQQRQTQAALELNRDRLTRSSGRLDGVQNSQEYSAVNKEIEQLRKLNATLEEQSKKMLDEAATVRKDIETINVDVEKLKGEREKQSETLNVQATKFDADITTLTAERGQYVGQVEGRLLIQYDRVRGARGGVGIVPAVAGRCKGCNMVVPPQLYNEVQRGSTLHQCPSCHRILFVPSQPEAAATQG